MSRKAQTPISLPQGVEVKFDGLDLTVKGPKGTLTQTLGPQIECALDGNNLQVSLKKEHSKASNFLGLYWALIANMVDGVSKGFEKQLDMIGVGYRANVSGNILDLSIGVSHPVKIPIPEGLQTKIEKNTRIIITGIDKQKVGQFAADVRSKRPPEPFKGKGIRYVDEYVRRKAGKAAKK